MNTVLARLARASRIIAGVQVLALLFCLLVIFLGPKASSSPSFTKGEVAVGIAYGIWFLAFLTGLWYRMQGKPGLGLNVASLLLYLCFLGIAFFVATTEGGEPTSTQPTTVELAAGLFLLFGLQALDLVDTIVLLAMKRKLVA